MGTDIHGWVEMKDMDEWWPVYPIGILAQRNYGMFGSLFGIRNVHGFEPIGPVRGLPDDVSESVRAEFNEFGGNHDPTWLGFREVLSINWNEEIISRQAYSVEPRVFEKWTEYPVTPVPENVTLVENNTFEQNGKLYRIVKVSRDQFRSAGWKLIFKWMGDLAEVYGEDNVRLIAWFDS